MTEGGGARGGPPGRPPFAVPDHVGFVMDGNRRWGQRRGLTAGQAYQEGCRVFEKVLLHSARRGVPVLTFFAFSTENWSRPAAETVGLYETFSDYIAGFMERRGVEPQLRRIRLRVIGNIGNTGPQFRRLAEQLNGLPESSETTCVANVAINYGSRSDITAAVRALVREDTRPVDETAIADRLVTAGLPDIDLMIRTGGEKRLSNFLLWEAAFAELLFEDCLWPDFDESRLETCLALHAHRCSGSVDAAFVRTRQGF